MLVWSRSMVQNLAALVLTLSIIFLILSSSSLCGVCSTFIYIMPIHSFPLNDIVHWMEHLLWICDKSHSILWTWKESEREWKNKKNRNVQTYRASKENHVYAWQCTIQVCRSIFAHYFMVSVKITLKKTKTRFRRRKEMIVLCLWHKHRQWE